MTRRFLLATALLGCGVVYAEQSRTAPGPAKLPAPLKPIAAPQPLPAPRAAQDCVKNPDADHDHHNAIACGGNDCDDNDANRFPANVEVCDTVGHDEDCDPSTYGKRDTDGDGFPDARCSNVDPVTHAVLSQGTDCDDTKPWVRPGSQVCLNDSTMVSVCWGPDVMNAKCPAATPYCAIQPNHLGVCVPAPH